jgi:multidrug efflux pump subunit AcrB
MRLPEISIKNRQFVLTMYLIVIALGVSSYLNMPRSEDPYLKFTFSGIVFIVPGASVVDLETGIVDPLEERLDGIEHVKHISSTVRDGIVDFEVEFEPHTDMEESKTRIESAIADSQGEFPPGIVYQDVFTYDILYVKILQLVVTGDNYSLRDLYKYSDIIKRELQKVDGAKNGEIKGYPEEEVAVTLNPEKLAQYDIPVTNIYALIQANNYNIPAGEVKIGLRKFNLRTSGKYESLREIGDTVVGAYDGKPVYLKDIAGIDYRYADPRYKIRHNGKEALFITFEQQEGKNLLKIDAAFLKALDKIKKRLPSDLDVNIVFEQAKSVEKKTGEFFANMQQGIVLVGIICLLIIGLRASIVVMFAIPTSVFLAIWIFNVFDFGLHQMTLTALIIALGMLVDNAIVISENIQRFMDNGYSRIDAAVKGAAEVGWPVVNATITTVIAYVPLMLMKEESGDYIRTMPLGVNITLLCSLLVALTLSPMLCVYALKPSDKKNPGLSKKAFTAIVEKFYQPKLSWAIDNRKKVISVALGMLAISIAVFPLLGVSFFPMSDKTLLLVNVNLPESASLDKTGAVMADVEKKLSGEKEIIDVVTNVGKMNPPVFYNMGSSQEKKNFGQFLIQLDKGMNPDEIAVFAQRLRDKIDVLPGVKLEVKQLMQGPPSEAAIVVRVLGDNNKILKDLSTQVQGLVEETEGCININNPLELNSVDMKLDINRDEAAMLGVQLVDINRIARMAVSGLIIGKYSDDEGKMYDLVLRLPKSDSNGLADFDRVYVPSSSGKQIPLSQLAKIIYIPGYKVVQHRDLQNVVSITADVAGRQVSEVNRELARKLDRFNFPSGYSYQLGGEEEARGESFTSVFQAGIIGIIGIFAVLMLQFRSVSQTLIIFVSVPFALVGAVLALLITGFPFSFSAFVGLTSLVGIVVNNAIILVDYTNKLLERGIPLKKAIITAGSTRLRPILATTLTTIGGLLPLTLSGGDMWAPLSWVMIGGLTVSTMLTLVLVPIFYYIFTNRLIERKKLQPAL